MDTLSNKMAEKNFNSHNHTHNKCCRPTLFRGGTFKRHLSVAFLQQKKTIYITSQQNGVSLAVATSAKLGQRRSGGKDA
jgi:hypothetical protein